MNTPSHLLIGAAARRASKNHKDIPLRAVLWGSVAPDLALYAITVFGAVVALFTPADLGEMLNTVFNDWFFNNQIVIFLHNFGQAPLVLLTGLLIALRMKKQGVWLVWFFVACLIHVFIDIWTHVSDGPLLLFPFDWSTRFTAPVSYWEPDHGGGVFSIFEGILDIFLIGYLISTKRKTTK